jgi:glycosyltransferase involved in cell wall biosynthesis
MSAPQISIVVLSCNRRDDLAKNLPRLAAWTAESGNELIISDNASSDGSRELLAQIRSQFPHVQVALNETNLGVGAGRNVGFRLATGEILLCLDDDSDPQPEFLEALPGLFAAYPEVGLISPRILHPSSGENQNDHGPDPCLVANFHGSCHAFRREVVDAIGLQDEGCRFGGEEIDFSIRAHGAGFSTLVHPDYISYHNSFVRPVEEQMKRWTQWVYNYARVLGKNFPAPMATRLANGYTKQFAFKFVRAGQRGEAAKLTAEGARGLADGLKLFTSCPPATVEFYSHPDLRPEFGNVTVMQKILARILRKKHREPYPVERRPLPEPVGPAGG